MGHETKRKSKTIGSAALRSDRHAAFRKNLPLCSGQLASVFEFGRALVSDLSKERTNRYPEPSAMGKAIFVDGFPKGEVKKEVAERRSGSRTHHRLMDAETDRGADSKGFRYSLYPCGGMEASPQRFSLELSKAGTTRFAEGREGHRRLEKQELAAYKKKPKNLGPIWRFSTKAGSCSSRWFVGVGHRQVRRRFCDTVTVMIKYPPSAALPYPPAADVLDFISDSMRITLPAAKSSLFCDICFAICADMLYSFGMAVLYIGKQLLRNFWKKQSDFIYIAFLVMRRNSIRLNTFGPMANVTSPTAHMKILIGCAYICVGQSGKCAIHSNCLNPAYYTQN